VADQEKIAEKQEELLQLNQDLYNLDKDRIIEQYNEIYDAIVEFREKVKALASDGDGLTAED
jgi:uncharacterized protein YjgD (DUF1641 family)